MITYLLPYVGPTPVSRRRGVCHHLAGPLRLDRWTLLLFCSVRPSGAHASGRSPGCPMSAPPGSARRGWHCPLPMWALTC